MDMKTTLQKTHTASTYLHARAQHLALLDTYGKNAWLVGNARLEDLLKDLEAEVVGVSVSLGAGLKGGGCGDWTYRGGNRGMR